MMVPVLEHLDRRPSLFLLAGLWAGVLAGWRLPLGPALWVTLAGVLASALTIAADGRRRLLILAAGLFILGALGSPEATAPRPALQARPSPHSQRFPVVLRLRLPFLLGQCRGNVRARVEEVLMGDARLTGTQVALMGMDVRDRRGQRTVLISGTFLASEPRRNPMAYDMQAANRRNGVIGSVRIRHVLAETCELPDRALAGLRRRLERLIAAVPETDARGVLEAILLGARERLSPRVASAMIRAGTYHVLAISGLHVGILVFTISILVTVMRLRRTQRVMVSLIFVACYVIFTGARPSAMRAGTFFLILSIARLLEYKVDPANAVCFAGTLLLVASPGLAWDLGFRLSLGAVFGMTLFLPQIGRVASKPATPAGRARRALETGLLAAFSAQVFTVPLILWSFGRTSIIAGLSNLVVLPVMSLALAAGLEAALMAWPLPALGTVFIRSASLLVTAALRLAGALASVGQPLVVPGRPHLLQVILYYGAVLWLGLFDRRLGRGPKLALLGAAFAIMLVRMPVPGSGGQALQVTFLYVGNGDACVMEIPGGETLVVDTGPASSEYDAARSVLLPFLALRGIDAIDRLLITHSHNDHYGGIPALLENVSIGEILIGTAQGEAAYMAALESARSHGVPVRCVQAGEGWESGGVSFEVLHPGGAGCPGIDVSGMEAERDDPNAWSVVLKVTLGRHSVLLTGDLTPAVQESLVAHGVDLTCDVLKVPHHGHPGATSGAFAGALGAGLAVISCGAKYFDEPDSATRALLQGMGMTPLSTRTDGAVCLTTDGRRLSVTTSLGGAENTVH
jgi:competence protein ComEC